MGRARKNVFPLADCHPSILQRVINLCNEDDLFLLRLVARRFRDAVGQRIKRLRPSELPTDLAAKFPNLVSLDLALIPPEDAPSLTPLLPRLPRLQELGLHKFARNQNHLANEWEPTLRTLTRLHFSAAEESGVLVEFAGQCSSLQRLEASSSSEGLRWEALHRVVARLAETLVGIELPPLGENQMLMAGVPPAQCLLPLNSGKLSFLRFECYDVDDDICTDLGAFTSLTALDIACSFVSDEGIARLCALTRLTSLRLDTCGYSCAGVAQLARLPHLAELSVGCMDSEEDGPQGGAADALPLGNALSGLRSLRQLELFCCNGRKLGRIKGAYSRLTKLVLNNAGLRDEPRCLQPLTRLRSLMLFMTLREEAQLRYLAGLVQLTWLDLTDEKLAISATGAGWLARLTALQQLSLAKNRSMTAGALQQLARLPALRVLDLSDVQLPQLAPLARLPLEWLRLSPARYRSADELPERLRVPFLKGRRRTFHSLGMEGLHYA